MVYIIQNKDFGKWEIAINTFKKIYLHRRPSYSSTYITVLPCPVIIRSIKSSLSNMHKYFALFCMPATVP